MKAIDKIALNLVDCPTCGADRWAYCTTTRGKYAGQVRASRLHAGRTEPLWQAFFLGQREGLLMAVDVIEVDANPDQAHFDIYADIAKALEKIRSWAK